MFATPQPLDWARDGSDWPNREASRFLRIGNIEWHVQVMGPAGAPALLLAHGTGASSHSFRDLMPLLAGDFRVVAFAFWLSALIWRRSASSNAG